MGGFRPGPGLAGGRDAGLRDCFCAGSVQWVQVDALADGSMLDMHLAPERRCQSAPGKGEQEGGGMSKCARCAAECEVEAYAGRFPGSAPAEAWEAIVDCRDRELANLRSLLRSQTLKLERAVDYLQEAQQDATTAHASRSVARAEMEVTSVLEALS